VGATSHCGVRVSQHDEMPTFCDVGVSFGVCDWCINYLMSVSGHCTHTNLYTCAFLVSFQYKEGRLLEQEQELYVRYIESYGLKQKNPSYATTSLAL
jgi:hypothetical protein